MLRAASSSIVARSASPEKREESPEEEGRRREEGRPRPVLRRVRLLKDVADQGEKDEEEVVHSGRSVLGRALLLDADLKPERDVDNDGHYEFGGVTAKYAVILEAR